MKNTTFKTPFLMKKIYWIAFLPFLIGVGSWGAYISIGSHVASDGTLIEPFFLVPLGYMGTFIGILSGMLISTWSLFHSPEAIDKWVFGLSWLSILCIAIWIYFAAVYV